jgi:hypothetical protein
MIKKKKIEKKKLFRKYSLNGKGPLRLNIPKAAQKKRKNMRNEMIPSDL